MPGQDPTLSDMIRDAAERGTTYAELAERTADPATGRRRISGAQLNRIARREETPMPTQEQMRGIAAALRQPYERVLYAALAQWYPGAEAVVPTPDAGASADHERMLRRLEEARSTIANLEEEITRMQEGRRDRPKSA